MLAAFTGGPVAAVRGRAAGGTDAVPVVQGAAAAGATDAVPAPQGAAAARRPVGTGRGVGGVCVPCCAA